MKIADLLFYLGAFVAGLLFAGSVAAAAFAVLALFCPGLASVVFVVILQYLSHLGVLP